MQFSISPIAFPRCQLVLPAVYGDELTYYETLCKFRDKLNEVIEVVGDVATIQALQEVITQIQGQIESLKEYIDERDGYVIEYSDLQNSILEEKLLETIKSLGLGNILVISQTSGKVIPVQRELDSQYDFLRYYAYNAKKADSYQWTAETFDGKKETAYRLDLYNATIYDGTDTLPRQNGD